MKLINQTIVVLALGIAGPTVACAQSTPSVKTTPAVLLADGEIRKIDLENGKITIKHGQIKSLDMPAMTMVFGMRDKSKLDGLKVGDKVKFDAVDEKGKMLVTIIELVK